MEKKIDDNIKRFCQLTFKINEINKELDKEKENFYDGGYSFEEVNEFKISQLILLQDDFKELLNLIFKSI